MTTHQLVPDPADLLFTVGSAAPRLTLGLDDAVKVQTLDCFSGRLTDDSQHPREVAPFPKVNPLTGPIAIDGVQSGDVVAIHLVDVTVDRGWGVSTVSPGFGALASTAGSPSLEASTEERVWIWHVGGDGHTLVSKTSTGGELTAPLRPFLGTLGVAPPHGEVRTSVHLGGFGGNLDTPMLREGTTVFLPAHRPGAEVTIGDGHLTQGDGEFAGTAVEGQLRVTLLFDAIGPDVAAAPLTPRLVTDDSFATVGWGRPVDNAFRVALHGMVRWVAEAAGLEVLDAYQLVSQQCEARIANMVNPDSSVTVQLPRSVLGAAQDVWLRSHDALVQRAGGLA